MFFSNHIQTKKCKKQKILNSYKKKNNNYLKHTIKHYKKQVNLVNKYSKLVYIEQPNNKIQKKSMNSKICKNKKKQTMKIIKKLFKM